MRTISRREHALAAVVLVIAVGAGYGLFRARPIVRRTAEAEAAAAQAQERLGSVEWPAPARGGDRLAAERAAIETEIAALETKLAGLEGSFGPAEGASLRLEILGLAQRCGVAIRESGPYPARDFEADGGARATAAVRGLVAGEPYTRPAWRMTVEASFGPLSAFLEGLGRLDRRVTILRYRVEVSASGPGRLRAVLVLAL